MVNSLKVGEDSMTVTPVHRLEPLLRIVRLVAAEPRRLLEALPAQEAQVEVRPERAERLVGADVRGGLLPPDVLLPCLQGENKPAPVPTASAVRATMRPGILRMSDFAAAMKPR